MAIFNYKKREISAKIVYYGPALCGKTTNVQYIHQKLNPRQRGELVSLATDADRTLFFDFLPIELENVGGFKTRFQIYTVPGQVYYNSTRKAVLTGVDGVIFVADSQASMGQENLESFNNLIENLKYYNRDISQIPLILQYNKRDLNDVMSVEDLDRLFDQPQRLSFSSSAVTGNGVLQTLTACCKQVLQDLKNKSKRTEQGGAKKPEIRPSAPPQPTIEQSPEIPPIAPAVPGKSANSTASEEITTNEIRVGTIPGPPATDLSSDQPTESDTGDTMTDKHPPFAFPGTPTRDLTKSPQPAATGEPFIPEISQVGKARIVNPYTITLPIRLATDPDQQNMLNIDITLTIKDFCKTI
ncbi:MAG: GTPase [Deltaproteobacteria bacterium]|nr:MAG: GTPase [Deltaproteobacteria bacterium]